MAVRNEQLRRGATLAAIVVSAGLVALMAVALLSSILGYRMLVVRSDSMAPALRTGDLIVTRLQRPASVGTGAIVTFADQSRGGKLVTHRVVAQERADGLINFTTRGDANDGEEHWSVASSGRVGQLALRVPRIGFAAGAVMDPWIRLFVLTGCAVAAGSVALRRIWVV